MHWPTTREALRWSPMIAVITLVLAGSCSHTQPYYGVGFAPPSTSLPAEPAIHRLILIGDAGDPLPGEPTLRSLSTWAVEDRVPSTVVFLGDNIYPNGLVRPSDASKIDPQIDAILARGARGIFIPGNHDWHPGSPAIRDMQAYVERRLGPVPAFLPRNGDPGPAHLDLPEDEPRFRLVVLDSDWWLMDRDEGGAGFSLIPESKRERRLREAHRAALRKERDRREAAVLREFQQLLDTTLPVVVVAHHPLMTRGSHGGFFSWRDHIFPLRHVDRTLGLLPLPIVGSLYPIGRSLRSSRQDIFNSRYTRFRKRIQDVMEKSRNRPLAYASGHDHNLQVFAEGRTADAFLVSGAGIEGRLKPVHHDRRSLFAHEHAGFMSLDFSETEIWLRVIEPKSGGSGETEVFRARLHPSSLDPSRRRSAF